MKKITLQRLVNAIIARIPYVKKIHDRYTFENAKQAWKKVVESYAFKQRAVFGGTVRKILIVPPDPHTLTGSRGDEAMLDAFIQIITKNNPNVQIAVVTATDAASAVVRAKGCYPMQIWPDIINPKKFAVDLEKYAPDAFVVVGADVMDGYYNSLSALTLLIYCDIAARLGIATGFLGFSFNASPSQNLKDVFDDVHKKVCFNVRDIISLERFKSFTAAPARLVADMAFCLKPDFDNAELKDVQAWIAERRSAGDSVLIFNVHLLLIKSASAEQIEQIIKASVETLIVASRKKKISWLLLPHDYRSNEGDNNCLKPIAEQLEKSGLINFKHVTTELSAAVLKAIAGQVDGVIAGRMHLAIASLGMGVPVLALTYQDKFQGLFAHFKLPEWLLLSPKVFLDVPHFIASIERFVDELDVLREQVNLRLNDVQELSQANFDFIDR